MAELRKVYQQVKNGKPYGNFYAQIYVSGRRQELDLGVKDKATAEARAADFTKAFGATEAPTAAPAAPAATVPTVSQSPTAAPTPLPASPAVGVANRIQSAFAKFAPAPAPTPVPVATPAPPAVTAALVTGPSTDEIDYTPEERKALAKMMARILGTAVVGVTAFATRTIGGAMFGKKQLDQPSEEEEQVIEKTCAIMVARHCRKTGGPSPITVLSLGAVGMGIGMYKDGTPIMEEKPPATVLRMHEGGEPNQDPTPEGEQPENT